jgi:hypothetical protein
MPVNTTKPQFAPLATYTRGPLATYTRGTTSHGYPRQTQFPTSHVYPYYLEKLSIYGRGSLGERGARGSARAGGPTARAWRSRSGGRAWRATVAVEAFSPWGGARPVPLGPEKRTHGPPAAPPMARHGGLGQKLDLAGWRAGAPRKTPLEGRDGALGAEATASA